MTELRSESSFTSKDSSDTLISELLDRVPFSSLKSDFNEGLGDIEGEAWLLSADN